MTAHGRLDEFACDRQKIVQRDQKGLAQVDDNSLLSRVQGRLQNMGRMRAVIELGTGSPFACSQLADAEASGAGRDGFHRGGDLQVVARRMVENMKMIYVGSMGVPDRDSGWISSFEKLGWKVIPYTSEVEYWGVGGLMNFVGKVCRRLNVGPRNSQMQRRLLDLADKETPVWVHFRLPVGFDRATIVKLKNKGVVVTEYFNDDAFSRTQATGLHWKFRHALPAYDGHFVWRSRDIEIYQAHGAAYVEHSPPYYDPKRVYLQGDLTTAPSYLADAAFIGHWEGDWRVDCLDALAGNGFSIILKGGCGGWEPAIKGRRIEYLAPVLHANDDEYRKVYANVVVGVCFFSKLNNDQWTRRAFEIVALGGVLVCERTEEAQSYFKDREEAFFFSTIEELVSIVRQLKDNPDTRQRVRAAGHARLMSSEHTILKRANHVHRFVSSKISAVDCS